jgi:hypothetical protein
MFMSFNFLMFFVDVRTGPVYNGRSLVDERNLA